MTESARQSLAIGVTSLSACIAGVLAPTQASAFDASDQSDLEEIVVTATRHAQSISDIPYNISALGAEDLKNSAANNLQSLTNLVPGLVGPDLGPRGGDFNNSLAIRGMSTSVINFTSPNIAAPLVSTYVDETPVFVNLSLTDIERVEILRGPQGTLYGSGSVGGTIRLIHNPPDTNATEAELKTTASGTQNAANPSESFDGILNVPLSDAFAVRASAGFEKLSGFTNALSVARVTANDQPILADSADPLHSGLLFTEQKGIDSSEMWYARIAALWKMTDIATFTASYQHQSLESDGFSQQRPGYELAQTLYIDQPGTFHTDLATLDASVELGFATLSSDTSYSVKTQSYTFDATGLLESLAPYYGNYPRTLSPVYETTHDKSFTEELRLVSKEGGPWDWVAGAYFNHRNQDVSELETLEGFAAWSEIPGSGMPAGCTVANPVTCPYPTYGDVIQYYKGGIRPSSNPINPDLNYTLDRTISFRDTALFGEASYHLTDKWQGTAGARVFWQKYQQDLAQTLPECGVFCSASGTDPTGLTAVENEQTFHNQIFKVNTSYTVAPRTLLYATWSEGFRHGGANALPTGPCYYCEPKSLLTYQPDTARNTELGIKGSFGSGSSYTLTLYHIDWRNPQIEGYTLTGGFQFVTNGVSARSQGGEAELTLHLAEPLKLRLGYSYTDARLTASFVRGYNDLVGVSGDELPNESSNQVTANLNYSIPMGSRQEFHASLDGSYRSSFWTNLPHSSNAQELGGFTLLNARVGTSLAAQWRIDAFVNNLANKIAASAISYTPGPDHNRADFVVRPRTAGLEVTYAFKKQ